MIKQKLSLLTLAVLAGVVMSATNASAAMSYTNGDLFLGFRSTSATQCYLVDIGQASNYRDASPGSTFSLSTINAALSAVNIAADLKATFGTDWASQTGLYWGVGSFITPALATGSTTDPANTLYVSKGRLSASATTTSFNRASNSTQSTVVTTMLGMKNTFVNDTATGNNTAGTVVNNTDANSWASYNVTSPASSFSYFSGSVEARPDTLGASGITGTALDLGRLVKTGVNDGSGNLTGVGQTLGSFSINSSGSISYSAVPEPSTYALLSLGGIVAFIAIRNRRKVNT